MIHVVSFARRAMGVLALAALMGCATTTPAPTAPMADPIVSVNLIDSTLDRRISVENLIHRRVGNVIQVNATLVNRSRGAVQVRYRPHWVDAEGFAVDDDAPWQPLVVNPVSETQISFTSRNASAARVRIDVDKT